MTHTLSRDVGAPIVQAFESCLAPVPGRPGFFKPYRCPAGVLTIGWGHTNHHAPAFDASEVWSQARCDEVFTGDMALFERHVTEQLKGARVTQAQFDALVSWAYNTGGPSSSSVWPAARAGDIERVCERLARWNKGGGRVLRGLVRRRDAECALYRGDIDGALRIAGTRRAALKPPPDFEGGGRATDRPMPPAAEVARQTRGAGAAAGAGAATAGSGTLVPPAASDAPTSPGVAAATDWLPTVLLIAGALIVAVAGIVAWQRWRALAKDWA